MKTFVGLQSKEIQQRLEKYWPNSLPEKKQPTQVEIFLQQLKSPLVYILLVAAVITWLLWDHEDSIIIAIAVLINTVLWRYQESKAGKALEALKMMLQSHARVIREWKKISVSTKDLVPWDIVLLKAGEKIPADGVVVDANRCFVMEAMLTGESVPIEKTAMLWQNIAESIENIDKHHVVYMGTIVQWWQAIFQVLRTWSSTEMGNIALELQSVDQLTPLQKQLHRFSKQLTWFVLTIVVIVFVIWRFHGYNISEMFTTAVALAVWAIPEGLLVALTAVLAIGMQRILKQHWLVKNLTSAETLWWVTVICSDKTWTLTQWRMSVIEVAGDVHDLAVQAWVANDEDNAVALATVAWAREHVHVEQLRKSYPKIDSIPFSSENKFFASLHERSDDKHILYVNGAPDYLLWWTTLSSEEKEAIKNKIDALTNLWYRLVAYAHTFVPTTLTTLDSDMVKHDLTWIWFVGMSDPVRPDVQQALEKTKRAWIKLIVITGDFANTAKHIMHQLWVDVQDEDSMLGKDLENISDKDLQKRLSDNTHVKLFARTKPEQKMRIVKALKDNGEIVAMMGDGVNDAPALKNADIGIVVNEATDVAKESADVVLLHSSFSTIVSAVEEGRGMFDNIRKIILYLLSDAFVEIFAILIALLLGYPLPLTAAMILWINLVSDWFPSLALTVDPKRTWIMSMSPRSPQEPIINDRMKQLILLVSLTSALCGLVLFFYILRTTNDLMLAQSVCFATFSLKSLVYVYSVRALNQPFWKESLFSNPRMLPAVCAGLCLTLSPFLIPWLGSFLGVVAIGVWWYPVIFVSFLIFSVIEIFKKFVKKV